jgi:hypothetical protein
MATKSESISELAQALAKAQGSMQAAKMASENPFLHNKYANLGDVIQAARKPLSDNGLSFTQHPTIEDSRVSVTTILMHASGQWIESNITLPLEGGKGISLAQSMGAIITYLRRYALSAILGIYADEDTDGNEAKPAQKSQPAQAPKPATAQHAPVTTATAEHAAILDWPTEFIQEMVIAYKANHANQIKNALKGSSLTPDMGVEMAREWMRIYKANRECGMSTVEATSAANEAIETMK